MAPPQPFLFDWSEDWAIIGGERIKLRVARINLSCGRAFLVRACRLQTHEMLAGSLLDENAAAVPRGHQHLNAPGRGPA